LLQFLTKNHNFFDLNQITLIFLNNLHKKY
jgi:hypothetical protein